GARGGQRRRQQPRIRQGKQAPGVQRAGDGHRAGGEAGGRDAGGGVFAGPRKRYGDGGVRAGESAAGGGVVEASPVRNRLLLIAAGLLFSTGGAAIKAATLTGWQVASFRSGVAAAVLLAAIPGARRGWDLRM